MRWPTFRFWTRPRHLHELRIDHHARPNRLQPVDDYVVARLQAVLNLPQPIVHQSRANCPRDNFMPVGDDVHYLLALVVIDGPVA